MRHAFIECYSLQRSLQPVRHRDAHLPLASLSTKAIEAATCVFNSLRHTAWGDKKQWEQAHRAHRLLQHVQRLDSTGSFIDLRSI